MNKRLTRPNLGLRRIQWTPGAVPHRSGQTRMPRPATERVSPRPWTGDRVREAVAAWLRRSVASGRLVSGLEHWPEWITVKDFRDEAIHATGAPITTNRAAALLVHFFKGVRKETRHRNVNVTKTVKRSISETWYHIGPYRRVNIGD